MKCRYFVSYIVCLLFVPLLIFSGCCSKKYLTTETVTVTKIDTVIKITRDTVPVYDTVFIGDTATAENSTAAARSYIDRVTGLLVLELTGKTFDLPVKANIITTVKKELPAPPKKQKNKAAIFAGLFVAGLIVGLTLFRK